VGDSACVKPEKISEHRLWGFDEEQREVLLGASYDQPELAGLVLRTGRYPEISGLWRMVWATGHELDAVYSIVESLEHGARGRKVSVQGRLTKASRAGSVGRVSAERSRCW
jgi:hypothetical protein